MYFFDHGGIPLHAGDGVTYFLVLSGFLFCWIFTREWKLNQKIDLKRVFRIMPAFLSRGHISYISEVHS